MKKLSLLMLVTLSASLAFLSSCKKDEPVGSGSQPGTSACKVTEINMTLLGETGKTTFTYNAAGQLIETQTIQNADVSGSLYTYNSAGQVTKIESYEDASKSINNKNEYTYGPDGVTEEKIYADNNGIPTHSETKKFEYANGVISKVNNYIITNGNESLYEYELYTYNTSGDVSMIVSYEDDGNGNWAATYRDTYTYGTQAATKTLLGFFEEDPNFPAKHYYTNQKSESYNTTDSIWETDGDLAYEYVFDSKGNPTKVTIGGGLAVANLSWECN